MLAALLSLGGALAQSLLVRNTPVPFPCMLRGLEGMPPQQRVINLRGHWLGRFCDLQKRPRGYIDICWFSPINLAVRHMRSYDDRSVALDAGVRGLSPDRIDHGILAFMNPQRYPTWPGLQVDGFGKCPRGLQCGNFLDNDGDPHVVCVGPRSRANPGGTFFEPVRDVFGTVQRVTVGQMRSRFPTGDGGGNGAITLASTSSIT